MNKNTFVETVSILLILLFTYTSISKFINHENFKTAVGTVPFIYPYSSFFSYAVPSIELITVGILIKSRLLGLYAGSVLMLLFTLYVFFVLNFARHIPCSCGGVIKYMTWQQHMVFNTAVTVLSILAAWTGQTIKRKPDNSKLTLSN
jgi:hypothetical protein